MRWDATERKQRSSRGLEMDKYSYKLEEMDKGAVTLVVDLAKACQKVQPQVVWAWATHFGLPHMTDFEVHVDDIKISVW